MTQTGQRHRTAPTPCATLDEILSTAAHHWPDRPALDGPQARYTFSELDERVTIGAAAFRTAGLRRGDRIAVVLDGGTDALVAFAAGLRAGGCVVPLDPASPDERLRFALADADCRVAVATGGRLAGLAGPACRVLGPGPGTEEPARDVRADRPARPDDLAYAIYTSGSTGTPKAVAVDHAAAVRHAAAAVELFALGPHDRVLQFASLGFDVAQEEIWPTWLAGGTVVVKPDRMPDVDALADLVHRAGVTVLQLPTAYWRALLSAGARLRSADFATVRSVVIGGEAAGLADARQWRSLPLAGVELINGYGPTECVVTATAYRLRPGDPLPTTSGALPIGSPLSGRDVFVLGADRLPVPSGETGELYVAGVLARGYLGREDLTTSRFLTMHLDGEQRLVYRTGDLVREGTHGLEFVGRTDNQVKLRGYRIELDEVEAVLRGCPGVSGVAAALVRRDTAEPLLGALVTGAPADLSAAAGRQLPAHMVPTLVVTVDVLPLTTSGKIDRDAVRCLLEQHHAGVRPVTPGGQSQAQSKAPIEVLRVLWQEVLGVGTVTDDDDFFALGGDSLLVMRLTARARAHGLRLRPADVQQVGVLAELARLTEPLAPEAVTAASAEPGVLDLLPAQQRWLYDGAVPDIDHFVLNALLRVPPALPHRALLDAARVLVRQHDILRSRYRIGGTVSARLVDVEPEDVVTVIDLPGAGTDEIEATLAACQRGLSLSHGPVFRLVHLRLGNDAGRLLVLTHHLLLDGWSMALLIDDVDTALTAAVRTGMAELPPPSAGPRELARATGRYVSSPQAREDAGAWLAAPWSGVTDLPIDGEGPGLLPSIRTSRSMLDAEATRLLLAGLPRNAPRPGTLLTHAILVAVSEWSGCDTQAIDVYGHSRDMAVGGLDLSRTVGYVQATYPVVRRITAPGTAGMLNLAAHDPVPARRYGFDALRFGSPVDSERQTLRDLPASPLRLNYRSQLDRLERRAQDSLLADAVEDTGAHRSPRQSERYRLMFEGDVIDGRFVVGAKYSTDHYWPDTVRSLTDRVAALLAQSAVELAS